MFLEVLRGPGAQVRAIWTQKSRPKEVGTAQSGLGGASQRGQDSQVWPVGSVLFLELWKRTRRKRDSDQVGGQSLSIRQVI